MSDTQQIIGFIGLGALIASGAGLLYFNWRLGLPTTQTKLIDTLKDQHELDNETIKDKEQRIKEKEQLINELQGEVKTALAEVAGYKAQLEEKERWIKDLTVLTNADPNFALFQAKGLEAIKRSEEMVRLLRGIAKALKVSEGNRTRGKG